MHRHKRNALILFVLLFIIFASSVFTYVRNKSSKEGQWAYLDTNGNTGDINKTASPSSSRLPIDPNNPKVDVYNITYSFIGTLLDKTENGSNTSMTLGVPGLLLPTFVMPNDIRVWRRMPNDTFTKASVSVVKKGDRIRMYVTYATQKKTWTVNQIIIPKPIQPTTTK